MLNWYTSYDISYPDLNIRYSQLPLFFWFFLRIKYLAKENKKKRADGKTDRGLLSALFQSTNILYMCNMHANLHVQNVCMRGYFYFIGRPYGTFCVGENILHIISVSVGHKSCTHRSGLSLIFLRNTNIPYNILKVVSLDYVLHIYKN